MGKTKKVIIEEDTEYKEREATKLPQTLFPFSWMLLILFVAATYAPFLGSRVIRTAGDDKVYVAQALEMERESTWFVQTLSDEPDYRKGPFHYLLLRMGMLTMGRSMWATVYMNLLLVIMGSMAVAALAGRHLGGSSGWAFWSGAAFALNAGIFSHVFASQMEVELASIFAVALFLLDRCTPDGKLDWRFWLIAGLAGTIKSPLHAAFLGASAILFWAATGSLRGRLRSLPAWLGLGAGVLFCVVCYLPPLIMDFDNFMSTYLGRETFEKGANGAPWHYPVVPILTYFLMPWMLVAFVAYADGFRRLSVRARGWIKNKNWSVVATSGHERLVIMGLCLIAPNVLFFLFHPYRGQNYDLPVISGLILLVSALWATCTPQWKRVYVVALAATGAFLLLVPIGMTVFVEQFKPMPYWWSRWTLPALWVGTLLAAKGFWDEGVVFNLVRPATLARKSIWLFWGVAVFLVDVGEREMIDIRSRYQRSVVENEGAKFAYMNLHKNVWSEWGYLNFWAQVPVTGVHTEAALWKAVERGDIIIAPGEDHYAKLMEEGKTRFPSRKLDVTPWRRWRTKGKNSEGIPVWKDAWQKRELSILEKTYYLVRFTPN